MRTRPPVLGILAIALFCFLAAAWTYYQAAQMHALRQQVAGLEAARAAAAEQSTRLAGTAGALEQRLQALEAQDIGRQMEELRFQLATGIGPGQAAEAEARLAGIEAAVAGLQADLDDLAAQIRSESIVALPGQVRLQVAAQRQGHNLSCESSAASMAASFQGVTLGEEEVLAALPRHPNPHLGFRGNVDGPTGGLEDYGVYAGPVLEVLKARGLAARLLENEGLGAVRAALARGNPVIAWITYNCLPGSPTTVTIADQAVTLVANQHAVVLTGYTEAGVWANDPWDGLEDFYADADLERSMAYFGHMAIEVGPPAE